MTTFDIDKRFGNRANALANDYYVEYFGQFGDMTEIERFPEGAARHILDREFAIDVRIHVRPRDSRLAETVFTLQEKFRRPSARRYHDLTIEFMQDRFSQVGGDWTHLAVDYYAYGYLDRPAEPTGFTEFYLIRYRELKEALLRGVIPFSVVPSSSMASMLTIRLDSIPSGIFAVQKKNGA